MFVLKYGDVKKVNTWRKKNNLKLIFISLVQLATTSILAIFTINILYGVRTVGDRINRSADSWRNTWS